MALGSCLTCIKYLLFIFNFLFWLAGCLLLGIGIWMVVDGKGLADTGLDPSALNIGGYGLIIVGSIIMVVGFFGCCGAIRESQCLLVTFFICLFIIFGITLGLGIYVAVNPSASEEHSYKTYEKFAKEYDSNPVSKEAIDKTNKQFDCCGYKLGSIDFGGNKPYNCATLEIKLCPPLMAKSIKNGSVVIAGVALGVGVILLIGMIFSMMLCCAIRDSF